MHKFKNSKGKELEDEASIFPLITFDQKTGKAKCVGTGFFVSAQGGFVTAKHVFYNSTGKLVPTLYGFIACKMVRA